VRQADDGHRQRDYENDKSGSKFKAASADRKVVQAKFLVFPSSLGSPSSLLFALTLFLAFLPSWSCHMP
jgi:hypothetical protein